MTSKMEKIVYIGILLGQALAGGAACYIHNEARENHIELKAKSAYHQKFTPRTVRINEKPINSESNLDRLLYVPK